MPKAGWRTYGAVVHDGVTFEAGTEVSKKDFGDAWDELVAAGAITKLSEEQLQAAQDTLALEEREAALAANERILAERAGDLDIREAELSARESAIIK